MALAVTLCALAAAAPATAAKYIVLYKQNATPADAAASVAEAGGKLVAAYPQIGVVIASSTSTQFAAAMQKDARVDGAVSTAAFGVRLRDGATLRTGVARTASAPAAAGDTFSGLQWDMRQIHVPEAHAVSQGSPSVVVGDIDTGIDWTHPDLVPNIDFADSASCSSGAPDTSPAAWFDDFAHGTHTAGTIAAAANGIGIVGVAPRVRSRPSRP